jgi:hypothetical protein
VTGLFLFAALAAALTATGYRTLRRRRRRRRLAALEGGSRATAIEVDAFSDIDDHLARRECPCGGLLASLGERSEPYDAKRGEPSRGKCSEPGAGRGGEPSDVERGEPSEGRRGEPRNRRILRVVRVECRRCEERGEVWFDATRAYH